MVADVLVAVEVLMVRYSYLLLFDVMAVSVLTASCGNFVKSRR